MPAKKVAISLSNDALAFVDRYAAEQGLSRSAWFERAVQKARRQAGIGRALTEARRIGIRPATDGELEQLRKDLARKR